MTQRAEGAGATRPAAICRGALRGRVVWVSKPWTC